MNPREPCFASLQVLRAPVAGSGAFNMALDEVLLASAGERALLRLYTWVGATVSFGYFETASAARHIARGRPIVRRWTGGGIVEHGEDLTYTLCVPRSGAFASLRPAESYRRIHASVAAALQACGWSADSQVNAPPAPAGSPADNACFARPVLHDLLVSGRKVAGGAQRRSRLGLLHQGSVQVHGVSAAMRTDWKDAMCRELPIALADACENRSATTEEISRAEALAAAKYATAAWTERF